MVTKVLLFLAQLANNRRLLEITGDYWRLQEITGDYWRLQKSATIIQASINISRSLPLVDSTASGITDRQNLELGTMGSSKLQFQ